MELMIVFCALLMTSIEQIEKYFGFISTKRTFLIYLMHELEYNALQQLSQNIY
jgi:hypothetical protein